MAHALIVGDGLAGLATAAALVDAGATATICGSVATEEEMGAPLLLGEASALRRFAARIGTPLSSAPLLCLDPARPGLRPPLLRGAEGIGQPAEGGLLARLKEASRSVGHFREALALARLLGDLPLGQGLAHPSDFETVAAWLDRLRVPRELRRRLLYPLLFATLGTAPAAASAKLLATALPPLLRDRARPLLLLPQRFVPAARLAARRWLEARGARFIDAPARELLFVGGRAAGIALQADERITADSVVLALPREALPGLVPAALREREPWWAGVERLTASPTLSVQLRVEPPHPAPLVAAVLDSPIHWLVVSGADSVEAGRLDLTLLAADAWRQRSEAEIVAALVAALAPLLPTGAATVRGATLRWQEPAPLAHLAGSESLRPRTQSPTEGLFVAADYVRTGLPASLESACLAAEAAARQAMAFVPRPAAPTAGGTFVPIERLVRPSVRS